MRAIFAVLFASLIAAESVHVLAVEHILPNLHRCKRVEDDIGTCIQKSIISVQVYLLFGIPQLNMSSLDPYFAEWFKFNPIEAYDGDFKGVAIFTHAKIYGLTNFIISHVEVIHDAVQIRFKANFPDIQIMTNYEINGQIPPKSIQKRGHHMKVHFRDIQTIITINGEYYVNEISGKKHFGAERSSVNLYNLGDVQMNFMDPADIASADLNKYLNDNWEKIAPEMLAALEREASNMVKTLANTIYSYFPIDKLLL